MADGDLHTTKTCTKCNIDKPLADFARGEGRHGRLSRCKQCKADYWASYSAKNRTRLRGRQAEHRANNPELVAKRKSEYYRRNRDQRKAYVRRWREQNRERRNQYVRDRTAASPELKLRERMSCAVRHQLRGVGGKRKRSTFSLLGYTPEDLRRHLEGLFQPGMAWENYGQWHIDHIRPLSSFSITSPDDPDFKEAWALANLQPLWAADNYRKRDKWQS